LGVALLIVAVDMEVGDTGEEEADMEVGALEAGGKVSTFSSVQTIILCQ
jgi:hypothetical protein